VIQLISRNQSGLRDNQGLKPHLKYQGLLYSSWLSNRKKR